MVSKEGNNRYEKSRIIPKEEIEYLEVFHEYRLALDIAKLERAETERKVTNAQDKFSRIRKRYKEWKNAKARKR